MSIYRVRVLIISAVILLSASSLALAENRNSEQELDFKFISQQSQDRQDKFSLAVARIKKCVDTGRCREAQKAFNQLKRDFPEIAEPDSNDLNLFIEAELLRCKGKLAKAAVSYRKLLDDFPESSFYEAAMDRQFRIATAFLAGEKRTILGIFKIGGYDEGVKMMERITERARDAEIAKEAAVAVAESYQKRKKLEDAYFKWTEIQEQWNTDPIARRALLARANCKHAMHNGPGYDASVLIGRPFNPDSYYTSAKACYEQYKSRYPQDTKKFQIDEKLELIKEQSALKQLKIAQYYQRTGNELSANLYYRMVVDDWPQTNAARMAREVLSGNSPGDEKTK